MVEAWLELVKVCECERDGLFFGNVLRTISLVLLVSYSISSGALESSDRLLS